MRSNSRRGGSPRVGARLFAGAAILLSVAGIAASRAPLVERYHRLRVTSDTYPLPAPEHVVIMSLGYRSGLADYLFGNLLVWYGIHFQEHRKLEFAARYLDTINALDPKFRAPYYITDTLLTIQPVKPTPKDFRDARRILERGMRELPYDSRLWLQAGQFMAYLAPPHFEDPEQKREWRLAGARTLARACELLSDDDIMPYGCITAAGMLTREGELDATVQFLERVLEVSDNEEIHELALAVLEKKVSERARARVGRRLEEFQQVWKHDFRFENKHSLLVLGPPFDPARCAGLTTDQSRKCATTWRDWTARDVTSGEP